MKKERQVINSRENVAAIIDELCKWLEVNDPSGFTIYYLKLAKKFLGKDCWESIEGFKDILAFNSSIFGIKQEQQHLAVHSSDNKAKGKRSENNTETEKPKNHDSLTPTKKLIEMSSIFSK